MKIVKGLKGIDTLIGTVRKTGQEFNLLVHQAICSIIAHAQATGDCTRAIKLVEAMPKSTKRAAVINSFADYSPIGMNLSTGKCSFQKEGSKLYRPFNLEAAKANPWYDRPEVQKEELPVTLAEVNKMVFALATRLQKKLDAGEVPANDVEPVTAQIVALKAVGTAQYNAQKARAKQAA